MLIDHGKDNDSHGGNEGPYEDSYLTPSCEFVGASVSGLPGEQGVFLFDVFFVRGVGRRRARQEGLFGARHRRISASRDADGL